MSGLARPGMRLSPEDFAAIRASWAPKPESLAEIASALSLGEDAFVFVDDSPAEREIVRRQTGAAVPEIGDRPERYISAIDRMGYFEATTLSSDDAARGEMYKGNAERAKAEAGFADYGEYLQSLEMKAEIRPFEPMHLSRIAQLTNKSNQFNLTARRFTLPEMEAAAADPNLVTLFGKLADKFGDNGVVAVAMGEIKGSVCEVILWLMSCRVIKRDMELAMMDELVSRCMERGAKTVRGLYFPTGKNKMVADFYEKMGFALESEGGGGSKSYTMAVEGYERMNRHIEVNQGGGKPS
jgi:FkbH-like protein